MEENETTEQNLTRNYEEEKLYILRTEVESTIVKSTGSDGVIADNHRNNAPDFQWNMERWEKDSKTKCSN